MPYGFLTSKKQYGLCPAVPGAVRNPPHAATPPLPRSRRALEPNLGVTAGGVAVKRSDSEINCLLTEMREALRQWRLASVETKLAMEVFKDSGGNEDGVHALRRAMAHHAQALQRYVSAIEVFTRPKPSSG